jgi:uncharacterized protein YprB with RNaseH-like and TPR domain
MDLRAKLGRLRSAFPVAPAAEFESVASRCERIEYDFDAGAAAASLPPAAASQATSSLPPMAASRAASNLPPMAANRATLARERLRMLGALGRALAPAAIEGSLLQPSAAKDPAPPSVAESPRQARITRLRQLIGEVSAREQRRAPPPLSPDPPPPPPWTSVPTTHGPLHVLERWLEPDHHHGRAAVKHGACSGAGTVAALTRERDLAEVDLAKALYLDTETTGLAGGTGTVAFLVGLARFEAGVFVIEQLIVPELGRETPVLQRLAERIAAASCVITYNGKSFDWPLLRTRFVLSRLTPPPLPFHIDLLHVSRRLWRPRLSSLRLRDIEREILSFEREHDIAGEEIPARYFEYLRSGATTRLTPVLEHNQNDLIALAALLGVMVAHFEDPDRPGDGRDCIALGRLALAACDHARARSFAQAALERGEHELKALLFASEVSRRRGEVASAATFLERALEHAFEPQPRAAIHLSLAKLYEHIQHDYAAALRHARRTEPIEGAHAQGRRLGRLHRLLLRPERRALASA